MKGRDFSSGYDLAVETAPGDVLSSVGMVIGRSRAMQNVATMMCRVARFPGTTVLLQGESETGKDVVARAINT